jgi:hypothetical protein
MMETTMLYTHMKLWTEGGSTWHSLSRVIPGGGCTDLTMGRLAGHEVTGFIAWAQSQRLAIEDARANLAN